MMLPGRLVTLEASGLDRRQIVLPDLARDVESVRHTLRPPIRCLVHNLWGGSRRRRRSASLCDVELRERALNV